MNNEIKNVKWSDDLFYKTQKEVLATWETGKGVDFQKGVDFHKSLPDDRVFSKKLNKAKAEGRTLIQPRAGVGLIENHIKLMQHLEKEGEADLLPTTIDSYTRQNQYENCAEGIRREKEGMANGNFHPFLNGFPAVNHGVEGCREVVNSVNVPLQIRHGTPDARLLAEIALCGGYTSYEGGGISYNIPYAKSIPIEQTMYDWQYIDRLTGIYEDAGVMINREPYGPLTGTLVPPCISHAVAIIEALVAAEQGVKNITVGYGQLGNLIQDVAAIRSLDKLTNEYLQKFGYTDVNVTTVLHQWMGGFPADEAKAFGVIGWGSAAAALSKATKVIVKSPHEAAGVPTAEANAAGLRCTKQVVTMLSEQVVTGSRVDKEEAIIVEETRCILDKCIILGKGDWCQGAIAGINSGVIDIPFGPAKCNAGLMLPARDLDGAVRILNMGNLPFTENLKTFHADKLQKRAKEEKREVSFQMTVDDVFAVGLGHLVGKPDLR
ncbi:MAG: methylaspartate mutase subunit E [Eubacteriales bacterium]|nr:methylaspartate mutase subunit E [Eubacteriales bacterium]